METEYGAETRREAAPFTAVRWLPPGMTDEQLNALSLPTSSRLAFDIDKNAVALFPTEWALNYFPQNNAGLELSPFPPKVKR